MAEDLEKIEEKKEEKEDKEKDKSEDGVGLMEKVRQNPFIASTIVLGVVVLVMLIGNFANFTGGTITGNTISEGEAGDKFLDFANSLGANANLRGVKDVGSFYEVTLMIEGGPVPFYVTKDGENYIPANSLMPLVERDSAPASSQGAQQSADVVKSDKPVVELFVMTHCPYGTQSEKGIISVFETLGDKIEGDIRFVHYFMHEPEEGETPRQVCIREEQPNKWYAYLKCFLEDGDAERCLLESEVDRSKVNNCIAGQAEEYYADDSGLSQGYGVGGSPTLVINGQIVSSGRDSQSYLNTICSAFNDAPGECEEELSSSTPSPGFGWESSGASTSAQC